MKIIVRILLSVLLALSAAFSPCLYAIGENTSFAVSNDLNLLYGALLLNKSGLQAEALAALKKMECYDDLVELILSAQGISTADVSMDKTMQKETSAISATEPAYTFLGEPTDLLTIETVEIKPDIVTYLADKPDFFTWRMKVRNTSGNDLPMKKSSMRIWYRYLDENQDVLWGTYLTGGYHSEVKSGKAEWIDSQGFPPDWGKKEFDSVVYLEIYGYTTTLHGSPDYEFSFPVLINVRDYLK